MSILKRFTDRMFKRSQESYSEKLQNVNEIGLPVVDPKWVGKDLYKPSERSKPTYPEQKFKKGDVVEHGASGKSYEITNAEYDRSSKEWKYDTIAVDRLGGGARFNESEISPIGYPVQPSQSQSQQTTSDPNDQYDLVVGDKIMDSHNGRTGTIIGIHSSAGRYKIEWDDGDVFNVDRSDLIDAINSGDYEKITDELELERKYDILDQAIFNIGDVVEHADDQNSVGQILDADVDQDRLIYKVKWMDGSESVEYEDNIYRKQ